MEEGLIGTPGECRQAYDNALVKGTAWNILGMCEQVTPFVEIANVYSSAYEAYYDEKYKAVNEFAELAIGLKRNRSTNAEQILGPLIDAPENSLEVLFYSYNLEMAEAYNQLLNGINYAEHHDVRATDKIIMALDDDNIEELNGSLDIAQYVAVSQLYSNTTNIVEQVGMLRDIYINRYLNTDTWKSFHNIENLAEDNDIFSKMYYLNEDMVSNIGDLSTKTSAIYMGDVGYSNNLNNYLNMLADPSSFNKKEIEELKRTFKDIFNEDEIKTLTSLTKAYGNDIDSAFINELLKISDLLDDPALGMAISTGRSSYEDLLIDSGLYDDILNDNSNQMEEEQSGNITYQSDIDKAKVDYLTTQADQYFENKWADPQSGYYKSKNNASSTKSTSTSKVTSSSKSPSVSRVKNVSTSATKAAGSMSSIVNQLSSRIAGEII